jgi:hypothetical protein
MLAFTIVNEYRTMNTSGKQFAIPLLMLGMLAMIFAVLAFAEKTREDGHLPERNDRGSGELISLGVATGLAVFLTAVPRARTGGAESRHEHPPHLVSLGMRCSPYFTFLQMPFWYPLYSRQKY